MSEQDSAVDMDPEEGSLRSIDSTSFDGTSRGGSRPTSSGKLRPVVYGSFNDLEFHGLPTPAGPRGFDKGRFLIVK